jgi:hypothetical protein
LAGAGPATIKLKNRMRYVGILFILVVMSGCYNDTEEQLYGASICNPVDISYSSDVVPILSNNCYACHGQSNAPANGAAIVLEGYDKIKVAVENGLLIESIVHGPNASPMPKNAPKLSDCKINTIKKWIEEGALNN